MLAPIPHPYPLLTFHDTTPVWTVGNTSGLLEVDETGVQALGVDLSFYVAVALSYLEFLEEKEVSAHMYYLNHIPMLSRRDI